MTIRVLVVDDSLTVRRRICDLLARTDGFDVVGQAADAATAITLCQELRPTVMTLDLVLPDRDGVAVTEDVMARCPVPILLVSSRQTRAGVANAAEAIAAGAVALLDKPESPAELADWERALVRQLRVLAGVPVIRRLRPRNRGVRGSVPLVPSRGSVRLVVLGASTGGPAALRTLLELLPVTFPLPIVAVVHTAPQFDENLARWLDGVGGAQVELARPGDLPGPDAKRVRIAAGGAHLVLTGHQLARDDGPPLNACRPSVDALFTSAAESVGDAAIGCLLTGMGTDGAAGLLRLRQAGATTLVQRPATCVVGGMPTAAIEAGAASYVGSIPELARMLVRLARLGGDTP